MNDLIKALTILSKYMDKNNRWPTHCEHDTLYVCVKPDLVSQEDLALLEELDFIPDDETDLFLSFRFGSC